MHGGDRPPRARPARRPRPPRPAFIAFELDHGPGPSGALEWSIAVRCDPAIAVALDGALSAAYPDVRLGHVARRRTASPTHARSASPGT